MSVLGQGVPLADQQVDAKLSVSSLHSIKPIKLLAVWASLLCVLALFLSTSVTAQHDYRAYISIWGNINSGKTAWVGTNNAYGPVFNFLAPLSASNPRLPRVIFTSLCLCTLLAMGLLIAKSNTPTEQQKPLLYGLLFLHPLFWLFVVIYGNNDAITASFTVWGMWFYTKRRDVTCGILLAIAIGIKFIPLVMVPFLVFSKDGIRWKLAASILATLGLIYCVSLSIWGVESIVPFLTATGRSSTLLSIFRFLRGEFSPLLLFTDHPNVDWLSVPLCLLGAATLFAVHLRYKLDSFLSALIALAGLLILYKVGHHQFYLTLIWLLVLWIGTQESTKVQPILASTISFIVWLGIVSFLFPFTRSGSAATINEWLALPTFVFGTWMLHDLARHHFSTHQTDRAELASPA